MHSETELYWPLKSLNVSDGAIPMYDLLLAGA